MLGGDFSQGSLREGAPRSGGGDCEKNASDLFTDEPSNLFVHALSLSRLRDSVSLRLGHAAALTTHCGVIHYRGATSLPP